MASLSDNRKDGLIYLEVSEAETNNLRFRREVRKIGGIIQHTDQGSLLVLKQGEEEETQSALQALRGIRNQLTGNSNQKGKPYMKINLDGAAEVDGIVAASVVNLADGNTLAQHDASGGEFNIKVAGPANAKLYQAKTEIMAKLGFDETLLSQVFELESQLHIVRKLNIKGGDLFLYVAVKTADTNEGMFKFQTAQLAETCVS